MGLTVAELEQAIVSQGVAQTGLLAEVADARGTARTLGARLAVALNPDGTLRSPAATVSFVTEIAPIISYPPTGDYVALEGDLTDVYVAKRRLRINGALLPYVTSSTYDAGGDYTVVNFSTPVGNSITSVEYSFDPAAMPPLHYSGNPDIEQVVSGISTFATKHLSDAQYKSLLDDILARVTITSLASVDDGAGVDLVGRAFKYVDTIDDLRTLTPTDAPVYVQCHTIPGDGGHGSFYWDITSTDADDGQDTIAVTGVPTGRWKRNIDPVTDELSTHINRTTAHGSTSEATPSRIAQRDANGCSSFAPGTDPSHAVVLGQLAAIIMNQIVSSFEGDLSGTNSGWLKLPGGMIIQWGKSITASTENTWIVHDFPIPFPTKAFVIVGTGTDASVNLDPAIRINIYGLGQFRIWNTGYTSKYVNWIALGYDEPYAIDNAIMSSDGVTLVLQMNDDGLFGDNFDDTQFTLVGSVTGPQHPVSHLLTNFPNDVIHLVFATPYVSGETLTLSYQYGSGQITTLDGSEELQGFTNMSVTNNSTQVAIIDLYTWPFDDNNDTPFILCAQYPDGQYKLALQAGNINDPVITASAYDPSIGGINLRGVEGARRHAWFASTTYCPVPDTVGWRVELDFKLNYTMPEYYTDAYNNTYVFFASILAISFAGAAYPWTFDINYSPLQRKFIEGFSGVSSADTYQLSTTTAYKLMLSRYDGYGIQLELLANGVSVLRHMFLITDVGTGAMRFDIGSQYDDRYFPATITNFRVYEHGEVV